MVRIVPIHPANQWTPEDFGNLVAEHERQEVRIAASYDAPIDRALIRDQVVNSILTYVMPAGNV